MADTWTPTDPAEVIGRSFGAWTVVSVDVGSPTMADVRCACGTEKRLRFQMIKHGKSQSCGCLRRPSLVGERFGRLVVICEAERPGDAKRTSKYWVCRCDCGNEIVSDTHILKVGDRTNCDACKSQHFFRHGLAQLPEYAIYRAMLQRCHDPKAKNFARYGGRGIHVCDRWRHGENGKIGVEVFLADMGFRPSGEHSIDRIDVDGPYAPENCRWVEKRLQANNKRSTIWVDVFGERMSLSDLALRMKVSYRKLYFQVRTRGLSPEEALRHLGVRIPVRMPEGAA